jgi:5-methylthioribose kinase
MASIENDQPIKVIDGEFAFVGPVAFDCGLFIANMLMSLLSQYARPNGGNSCVVFLDEYRFFLT